MTAMIELLRDDPPDEESNRHSLRTLGLRDAARAIVNLQQMAALRIPIPLLETVFQQLIEHLPGLSDPDMALNNLERFLSASRSPLAMTALFERDPTAIPILLKIFSSSQYLSDELIRDPSSYDALRLAAGQPVSREILFDELDSALSVLAAEDDAEAIAIIRRFKHRETLRIAFGDIIGEQDLHTVTCQISYLADAVCQATLEFARRKLVQKHGEPITRDGDPCTGTVIAMGKLGGLELNYSSDIDLNFFYRADGSTSGPRVIENRDFHDRLGRRFVKLLSENTPLGVAYRVDLRLRPGGAKAPLSCSLRNAISYYDVQGRTWERQAWVKARPVAGDLELGRELFDQLQNWIYVRRLTTSEIKGIRVLKRQIEQRARQEGDDTTNLKTGHGGIRDIEFTIQFLQLLHGEESPAVRTGNTLEAIDRLYQAGCLNSQEQALLDSGYRWLRQLEHRLQILFDLQTHSLPESPEELYRVARRMGFDYESQEKTLERFRGHLQQITSHHRTILDHLLHDAFSEETSDEVSREGDLVLDPFLSEETAYAILDNFGFENLPDAYRHLQTLATEKNRFLSPRRCRHFLAAIARPLLVEIATTPQPDETLLNLTKVSESLGGKSAIWELFSAHQPSLRLFVRLCSACDYLCNLLINNPGMIDELTDALIIQKLPTLESLRRRLQELVAGAEDTDPILHSFKDTWHLRTGVRDITGQDKITRTHLALSDVAEVCLETIVQREERKMIGRYGQPTRKDGSPCQLLILALGKLGGREPNYHSDLDVIFLYETDGNRQTEGGRESTTHHDYFSRLAANVTKQISRNGPFGKLYEIDSRLRPGGKSGPLAVSVSKMRRYFAEGRHQFWERLAMCKARPLGQCGGHFQWLQDLIQEVITCQPWEPRFAQEVADMRLKMQEGASKFNIKRGFGGTVDIEFAIQMLQIKYGAEYPDILVPNTIQAARSLYRHLLISKDDFDFFCKSYEMLRWVEARLRLMNTTARHDLPDQPQSLARLAFLLQYEDAEQLLSEIEYLQRENRRRFTQLVESQGDNR